MRAPQSTISTFSHAAQTPNIERQTLYLSTLCPSTPCRSSSTPHPRPWTISPNAKSPNSTLSPRSKPRHHEPFHLSCKPYNYDARWCNNCKHASFHSISCFGLVLGGLDHCCLLCRVAKFRDLMYQVEYGAVIGKK